MLGQSSIAHEYVPPLWAVIPFVALLLLIATLPLIGPCAKFWERNRNKLLVVVACSVPVLLFYFWVHPAMPAPGGELAPVAVGWGVLKHMLAEAMVEGYFPFIVLLLSLYVIAGGIELRGDVPAHPRTNAAFLGAGAILASFIGTTGAAMLLIRPLLQTNQERKHVRHTVIFFIFMVCNTGGCLLPVGDPPLFLGYLRGVPFLWMFHLTAPWAICNGILLAVYYVWDCRAYRRELPENIARDERDLEPFRLHGRVNLAYLAGVVLSVPLLVPGQALPLCQWRVPDMYLREIVMLTLAGASLVTTSKSIRRANQFTFGPMVEVAVLFIGIFITMQAPIEILRVRGASLGLARPWEFFWASGTLSSFLDNAPTYVVFFQTASAMTTQPGPGVLNLPNGSFIRADLLAAVSLGSVFMGANTYIGNGPNFMVKAIAEQRGVKMPSFFHYMLYSVCVLIPLFVLLSLLMFALKWL